jgi:hypothetical protein
LREFFSTKTIETLFNRVDDIKKGKNLELNQWYKQQEKPSCPTTEQDESYCDEYVTEFDHKPLSSDNYSPPVKHWSKLNSIAKVFAPRTKTSDHRGEIISKLPKDETYDQICEKVSKTIMPPQEEADAHYQIHKYKNILNSANVSLPTGGLQRILQYAPYQCPIEIETDKMPYPEIESFLVQNPNPRKKYDKKKKTRRRQAYQNNV